MTTDKTRDHVDEFLGRLVSYYSFSSDSIDRARRAARHDIRIDKILVQLGILEEQLFVKVWADLTNIKQASRDTFPKEPLLPDLLSGRFLRSSLAIPLRLSESTLALAISDPLDTFLISAVQARTSLRVEPEIAASSDIRDALDHLYPLEVPPESSSTNSTEAVLDAVRLKDLATESPSILLANEIVKRAVELKASDIHLIKTRSGTRLRFRVDGALRDDEPPPSTLYDAIISRIKVIADLDIAERRLPQDGRVRFGVSGREIDLRVATMPHLDGEGVVIRLLDRSSVALDLEDLDFPMEVLRALESILDQPHGIFLVTGPTGSGKTTTLYSALRRLIKPERNIVSVEDPVEYYLDGVAQIQVQRKIGLDFPSILRSILRQDPDVIMIGEIRDPETAAIANQAALTGHFVLATLHTNSAAASLPRLIDMGVEPYLLASTIRGALSQRLIRLLCASCARQVSSEDAGLEAKLSELAERTEMPYEIGHIRVPVGCQACKGTGYSGRTAIAEIIASNNALRDAVIARSHASKIARIYKEESSASMLKAGASKVFSGQTSLTELLRVSGESAYQ